MKRFLLTILLLLLASPAWSFSPAIQAVCGASGVAALSCTMATAIDSCVSDEDAGQKVGNAADTVWRATRYVAAGSDSLCGLKIFIKRVGTDATWLTRTVTACVYPATVGCTAPTCQPVATASCSTNTLTTNDISAVAYTEYSFTGISIAQTATTNYWVSLSVSAAGDASNYLSWRTDMTACATEDIHKSADGATWVGELSDRGASYKTYKLE